MRHSKTLATALLTSWALSACSTVEYIEVTPQCTPPSQPALPSIDKGELWDALGDAQYRQLERYILQLWAFADEQTAMLDAICNRG
jgi:hypothetical protein